MILFLLVLSAFFQVPASSQESPSKVEVSQELPKRPKVNDTHHFLLVTHSQGLKLTGAKQTNRSHTFRRNTLIPVVNYSHTKKRRAGLLGDLVVPDEYKADLLLANNLRMAVDYRVVMKSGKDYEWRWDTSNRRVTGREFYNQPLRKAFHNLILKFNGGFGLAFLLLLVGVPFGMAAAFGQAVIKEVDAPLSELVAIGIFTGIGIILLWFFGSVIGGWYQDYLDPFEAINAKFEAVGGLVPIQLTSSEIPDGVGFLYYVFNVVYIPYLLLLSFLVVRFAWPVVIAVHYALVPHPAERSVKAMLRLGKSDRSAMDELKRVFAQDPGMSTTKSAWKLRNDTRRMEQLGKKIAAENTVLDGLISFLRKKHVASHLDKNS